MTKIPNNKPVNDDREERRFQFAKAVRVLV